MSATTSVGGRIIGSERDVFVIAEAGVNHNGNLDTAHELIDVAARSRADAVKFQTFRAELVVSKSGSSAPYQQRNGGPASQLDLLKALVLPDSAWAELKQHCDESGVIFLSTPFDLPSAELLAGIDVPAFKIGSGELTNLPFLRRVAGFGRPMLMSTGMADLDEVRQAIEASAAAPGRALFHCVSAYPSPIDQANLLAIRTMRDEFDVPVGWSDHTTDSVTAIAAVAVGASLIEKHFTLDPGQDGPDHAASLDPDQLTAFVAAIRAVSSALGSGRKERAAVEQENARLVRRSWHLSAPVAAGEVVTADMLVALRPEGGLPMSSDPAGRRAARDLQAGDPLRAEDLE